MSKLTDLIEKNLEQSIKQSEEVINKSMKKTEEPGLMAFGVTYIIFSLLLAWWGTWILPHFTEQVFGYWQLAGAMLLAYAFVLPREISWLPFSICGASTIYIWLFM